MKKHICFFLVAVMLLGAIPVLAYQDVEDSSNKRAIEFISMLGIAVGDNNLFRPQDLAKKEEAATILVKLGCLDSVNMGSLATDVSSDRWSYQAVNTMAGLGMMPLTTDGKFYPERPITVDEMKSPLLSLLGYQSIDAPIRIQAESALLKGLTASGSEQLTRGEMAQMVYNALDIEMVSKDLSTSGSYVLSGQTLLEWYLGQKDMILYRGILEATDQVTLNTDEPANDGCIVIDGQRYVYEGTEEPHALLGRQVEFAVVDEDETIPTVIYMSPYRNEELVVDADDLEEIGKAGMTYIDPETEEEEEVDFAAGLAFVYNGRAVLDYVDADMIIANGSYTLVDNNDDGTYEVVLAEAYESFVVKSTSTALDTIYLQDGQTYRGRNNIALSKADNDYECTLVDAEGEPMELADVVPYDAITVVGDLDSQNLTVMVSKEKIYGTISEITERYVILEGEEYRIGKDASGEDMLTVSLNALGNYIIDAYGKIVGFEETGESKNYGYVTATTGVTALGDELKLKIVTGGRITELEKENAGDDPRYSIGNEAIAVYNLPAEVRVNGERLTREEREAALTGQVVSFTSVGDEIRKIETLRTTQPMRDVAFNPDIKSFGGLFYVDENTNIMCIPTNAGAADDDYYTLLTLEGTSQYTMIGYDIDPDTKIARAAVLHEEMQIDEPGVITKSTKASVVQSVSRMMLDDEEVWSITLYNNGEQKKLYAKDSAAVGEYAESMRFGDVIYYSVNSQGVIDNIEFVEHIGSDVEPFHRDVRNGKERIFGTLYTLQREELSVDTNTEVNTFGVSLTGDGSDRLDFTVESTETPVIYLIDTYKETITPITIDELAPYREFGEDAMQIFIGKRNYQISSIVAVR